jgi:hypothetical protein
VALPEAHIRGVQPLAVRFLPKLGRESSHGLFFCRQSAVQMPSFGDLLRGEKQAGSKERAHLLPDGASADVTRCRGLAGMPQLQWARPGVYDAVSMP